MNQTELIQSINLFLFDMDGTLYLGNRLFDFTKELLETINQLKSELAAEQQTAVDAGKWIESVKNCAYPTELTAELLNALIEKIVIHESTTNDKDGTKCQKIEIYYRFIGKIE